MYKVIGANQAEYGPATVQQVRQWIAEGRINGQTMCQAVGETDWKPLASVAAFADLFVETPPPLSPPPFKPAAQPQSLAQSFPTADAHARARVAVNVPAIGLMITAALGVIAILLQLAVLSGIQGDPIQELQTSNWPPVITKFLMKMSEASQKSSSLFNVIQSIIGLFSSALVIWGAVKMMRLQNHGLASAAAILAIVPCFSPCCCLGIPFGIWALIVLNKPEVKSQFT